jgi:DNA primase
MSLDFQHIKEIRITDVCGRYGISLRFGPEWASAKCPLPTHKDGDKDRTFQVNTKQNYWKCWSASCNEKAGKKGGDIINFVSLMENCSQLDAAKKLSEMFHVNEKAALHMAERPKQTEHQKDSKDDSSPAVAVNYMASIDQWFDETFKPLEGETDEDYWKRARKTVKSKLVESFRAGQKK